MSAPSRRLSGAEEDEAALVRAVLAGDDGAFRTLYEAHAGAVTRRIAHAVGDAEVARDLAQDVFVTALARLERFRGDSSLSTWLHAIAFNHVRDHRKRTRRRRGWWSRRDPEPEPAPAPSARAEARDDLARLRAAIAALKPVLRDAYVLRVVEEVSLRESSQILGAREATISYRARRAERLVRAAMDEGEDGR